MRRTAADPKTLHLPIRNSRLKLPQGKLFWREAGQGEAAVIFLHGTWHEGSQWIPLMQQLGRQFHCFALDLLGFGESERPNHHYSIALEVECLADYIAALRLQQVYLVGHSLGAWIAASYALQNPEQIAGLVLIAPEGVEPSDHSGQGQPRHGFLWSRLLAGRVSPWAWILRSLLPLARVFRLQHRIQRSLLLRQQLQQSPTACQLLFQRRRSERDAELLQEQLPWLKVPILILHGDQDPPAEKSLSRTYAQHAPYATLEVLPGNSADMAETQPAQLAQRIQDWIESL